MIQVVSNLEPNLSRVGIINYKSKSNYMSTSNQFTDTFTNSKQTSKIAFKGNPLSLIKGESKVGEKISKLAEKATESIGVSLKKLKGKNELPITKKPVTAAGVDDFLDTLTDGVPVGGAIRTIKGIKDGDKKQIVKGGASLVDNTVLAPTKYAAATAAAGKGAVIGAAVGGPAGAAIGGAIGFVGTIWVWGKVRNKVVDGFMDD